jgi:biotin-dependent carboxylase-like uncharacterized protein
MNDTYLEILRPGINTTIQDEGRNSLYHIGITISGAMDQRNYNFANKIVGNSIKEAALEFAYQGPLLKLHNGKINFAITGNIFFNIIRKNSKVEEGKCYQNYVLNNGEQIDIISTKKTVYGYLSISGGFELEKIWGSYSVNTKAEIGPNNGKKFNIKDKIFIKKKDFKNIKIKEIDYKPIFNNIIRVIKGTNFNYFSINSQKTFLNKTYSVSRLVDRMGMRLDGPILDNICNTNIKSEGLVRGVIQVPGDGKPIILLSDHGTIGGYPKIAVVISADLDKVAQLTPGTNIKFKEVNLEEAEKLFNEYNQETNRYLSEIN